MRRSDLGIVPLKLSKVVINQHIKTICARLGGYDIAS